MYLTLTNKVKHGTEIKNPLHRYQNSIETQFNDGTVWRKNLQKGKGSRMFI